MCAYTHTQVGTVTSMALAVYAANALIVTDPLHMGWNSAGGFGGKEQWLSLPALPFSLSSSALGLLLVFRTNNVFFRWNNARLAFQKVQVCHIHSF